MEKKEYLIKAGSAEDCVFFISILLSLNRVYRPKRVFFSFFLWINGESWSHTYRGLHVPISASPWRAHAHSVWKLKHYFSLTETSKFTVRPDASSSPRWCVDVWAQLCALFYTEGQIVITHNDKLSDWIHAAAWCFCVRYVYERLCLRQLILSL